MISRDNEVLGESGVDSADVPVVVIQPVVLFSEARAAALRASPLRRLGSSAGPSRVLLLLSPLFPPHWRHPAVSVVRVIGSLGERPRYSRQFTIFLFRL